MRKCLFLIAVVLGFAFTGKATDIEVNGMPSNKTTYCAGDNVTFFCRDSSGTYAWLIPSLNVDLSVSASSRNDTDASNRFVAERLTLELSSLNFIAFPELKSRIICADDGIGVQIYTVEVDVLGPPSVPKVTTSGKADSFIEIDVSISGPSSICVKNFIASIFLNGVLINNKTEPVSTDIIVFKDLNLNTNNYTVDVVAVDSIGRTGQKFSQLVTIQKDYPITPQNPITGGLVKKRGLSTGALAGIIVGGVGGIAVVSIIIMIFIFYGFSSKKKKPKSTKPEEAENKQKPIYDNTKYGNIPGEDMYENQCVDHIYEVIDPINFEREPAGPSGAVYTKVLPPSRRSESQRDSIAVNDSGESCYERIDMNLPHMRASHGKGWYTLSKGGKPKKTKKKEEVDEISSDEALPVPENTNEKHIFSDMQQEEEDAYEVMRSAPSPLQELLNMTKDDQQSVYEKIESKDLSKIQHKVDKTYEIKKSAPSPELETLKMKKDDQQSAEDKIESKDLTNKQAESSWPEHQKYSMKVYEMAMSKLGREKKEDDEVQTHSNSTNKDDPSRNLSGTPEDESSMN